MESKKTKPNPNRNVNCSAKIQLYVIAGLVILAVIAVVLLKNNYADRTQIKPETASSQMGASNEKYLGLMREVMNTKDSSICLGMKNQTQKDMCLDTIDCINLGMVKEKTICGNRTGVYMMPFTNNTIISQATVDPSKDVNSCAKIANETTRKACEEWVRGNQNST